MNPTTTPSNKPDFASVMQAAKDLGEQAGKGKDTQIKFLLKAVEGAYHGALDLTANKHGTGMDDATKLAEIYTQAKRGSTVFDAKNDATQKLSSTLRTSIKLGSWPKGGNGEPLATVNNLISKRQKLRQDPATAKKLDDAANTLMKYARAQLKEDTLIPDDELESFCYRKQAEEQTVEDILDGVAKKLDKLVQGNGRNGLHDGSQHVKDARFAIHQRLAAIAKSKNGK